MAAHDGAAGNITLKTSQLVFGAFRPARQAVNACIRSIGAFLENYATRQLALRRIGRAT